MTASWPPTPPAPGPPATSTTPTATCSCKRTPARPPPTCSAGTQQLTLNTGTSAVTGTRFLSLPGGGLAARTGAGTAYSFEITDQHGTSLLTLDHTAANPAWRQYTPYGAPRGQAPSSWPDTHAFLGKPADTTTSLDIIGARQYDPATGRFLSVDPVLDTSSPQTLAGYAYAASNPVTSSDPTGLCIYSWCPPPPAHGTAPPSKYGPGSGGGDPVTSTPGCDSSPSGCFSSGPPPIGEQPYGSDYSSVPDVRPVAAHYAADAQPGSVVAPGCNEFFFKDGACPGEAGAAGTTPKEVRRSALGALGVVLGGLPIGDLLDLAIGSAAEDTAIGDAAAACGGMSFTPGTKVLLASGIAVPIASLRPGDKVLATNTRNGKTRAEPVTAVLVHHDANLYNLEVRAAHRIVVFHTTSNHFFWDSGTRHWIKAADVGSGEVLRASTGVSVTAIGGYTPKTHSGWMWDLTIPYEHDFYIGTTAVQVLVHNCAAPGGRISPAAQGAAGVEQTVADIEGDGGRIIAREVGIKAAGWRTRADLYAELPSGQRAFIEVKTGPGAGLSLNQEAAYPEIISNGGVPYGQNAANAGLTPGVPIGPTPVWVVLHPWPLGELP